MSTGRNSQGTTYPSLSWADSLDMQRSALRWDVKRAMKSLCGKLAEIGEECFVVTVNISNGWVGHLGTPRGDEYINEKPYILYDFLNYSAESFHAEQNEEKPENNGSDTDSCHSEGNHGYGDNGDDETPITLSRPGDDHTRLVLPTVTRSDGGRISVEAPTKLQTSMMIPVKTSDEKLILLSPTDIQNATQRVLDTEYKPVVKNEPSENVQIQQVKNALAKKDNFMGSKRKRKQSLEDIDKDVKGKTNQRNKISRDDLEDASTSSEHHATNINTPPHISKLVNSVYVSESTRVLRDRNLHRKKKENSDDDDDDNDNDDNKDDDDDDFSDYDIDDAKDKDWDVDYEVRGLYGTSNRDNLGRFIGGSNRRSGRKQSKDEESFEHYIETVDDETVTEAQDGTSSTDSEKLVRVNFIHKIKVDEKSVQMMEGRLEKKKKLKVISTVSNKKLKKS